MKRDGEFSTWRRQIAWILILIVNVGYIALGAGAALAPDRLLGPGGKAILPAGYEGYSGGSWSQLAGRNVPHLDRRRPTRGSAKDSRP